jgi:hypothetical protein
MEKQKNHMIEINRYREVRKNVKVQYPKLFSNKLEKKTNFNTGLITTKLLSVK